VTLIPACRCNALMGGKGCVNCTLLPYKAEKNCDGV
jgi:hypothetical protein